MAQARGWRFASVEANGVISKRKVASVCEGAPEYDPKRSIRPVRLPRCNKLLTPSIFDTDGPPADGLALRRTWRTIPADCGDPSRNGLATE